MEAFSIMIFATIHHGSLLGFSMGPRLSETINISHLLFADDMSVLCGAKVDHMCSSRALLVCFEAASGLKANMAKSALVPIGNVDNVVELAGILGCETSSPPLKYLGLLLGAHFQAKVVWDGVVEKVERCLDSWKRMYLSKGGRVTLIKSTLSNLPMYFLSLFPIAATVANRIEKLQCDFLWGVLGEEFKYHLVS
jgi:hypothetical protein